MAYELVVAKFEIPPFDDIVEVEHASPDEPIRLALAPYLPEISLAVTEKVLRGAIDKGILPAERIGRKIFVTRHGIAQWREQCRVSVKAPVYGSSRPGPTSQGSDVEASGSSATEARKSARDAARLTFAALRNSLKSTSPGVTPRLSRSSKRAPKTA